jgi:integrase
MFVQQGVVNGRIGKVKTEASQDEVPMDPAFAEVLLKRRGEGHSQGLVFQSPVTGGCYYSGIIQRKILKPAGDEIGIAGWAGTRSDTRIDHFLTRRVLRLVYSRS